MAQTQSSGEWRENSGQWGENSGQQPVVSECEGREITLHTPRFKPHATPFCSKPGSLSPLQNRSCIGAGGHPGVACQPSAGEASRAWLPGLAACGQLLVREPDRELAGGDVDVDDVAVAQ